MDEVENKILHDTKIRKAHTPQLWFVSFVPDIKVLNEVGDANPC